MSVVLGRRLTRAGSESSGGEATRVEPGIRHRDQRGTALIEFAIAMLFLPLLMFGIVDLSRAYQLQSRLRNAAREGTSLGQYYPANVGLATCPASGSSQTIIGRVLGADSTDNISASDVTVVNASTGTTLAHDSCGSTFTSGQKLKVTVTKTFVIVTPLVALATGKSTFTLSATSIVVAQR